MLPRKIGTWVLIFLVISPTMFNMSFSELDPRWEAKKKRMSEKVRKMFYHAYDNYMTYAFPHDELKPLTKTFTDSLNELGNLKLQHLSQQYNGSALTLIESLSSLVILGNNTEFDRAVLWLSENLTFDVDVRINLFECNIRVLGGLVSAHILATDSTNRLVQRVYKNQLLILAEDLGRRILPAFDTPTGLPYAWINLKMSSLRTSSANMDFMEALAVNHDSESRSFRDENDPLNMPSFCAWFHAKMNVGRKQRANMKNTLLLV
ncbi:unnamed protein product [Ilex paraguariensis]|uniref:alpha-1,2-Mannosidase n=1 Tax=Ilex paraguariensis TaxID=185542 RepID=A0ABC8R0X9_9AQUA